VSLPVKPLLKRLFFYPASILLVAQTTSSDALFDWFTKSFLSIIPWLFLYIVILMFIYAVLRAPLEVLRSKAKYIAPFLVSATVSDYFTSIASTLFSLLTLVFMLLLPLILILLLYKAFFALVKAK
jgi:hypothetical protein